MYSDLETAISDFLLIIMGYGLHILALDSSYSYNCSQRCESFANNLSCGNSSVLCFPFPISETIVYFDSSCIWQLCTITLDWAGKNVRCYPLRLASNSVIGVPVITGVSPSSREQSHSEEDSSETWLSGHTSSRVSSVFVVGLYTSSSSILEEFCSAEFLNS